MNYSELLEARKNAGNDHHARGCECRICTLFPHPDEQFPDNEDNDES